MGLLDFATHVIDRSPDGGGIGLFLLSVLIILAVGNTLSEFAKALGRRK